MHNFSSAFFAIQTCLFGLIIILAFVYSTPVLLYRRFRSHANIFSLNLCFAITLSSVYWIIYYTFEEFYFEYFICKRVCFVLFYLHIFCILLVPYAFIVLSVYRFCLVVYCTKQFFTTKAWLATNIISQYIVVILLPLPVLLGGLVRTRSFSLNKTK